MKNGALIVAYHSNSSLIRVVVFTPNVSAGSKIIKMPYFGLKQLRDSDKANAIIDLEVDEICFSVSSKKHSLFDGASINDLYPNANEMKIQEISSPVSGVVDLSSGNIVQLLAGADGSTISGLSAGDYIGQPAAIAVSSRSNTTVVNETGYSPTSISFANPDGNNTKIQLNGSTSSPLPPSIQLRWLGSVLGWHTQQAANAV
ncbi:hypothetical protein VP455E521_P0071 [Vibrio phage 455E52-1]|nr:hypothetical protein VP455E521_P0071 [Vibrio phage 455E52-1]